MSESQRVPLETTLSVKDACLCLHVQRAARALARRFDHAFQPVGLTNGQFSLMMALNGPRPAAMGAVASLLAMDRSTLTAALKPLERRGLVAVEVDPEDRRARRLVLTGEGHALLLRALPIWTETHRALETELAEAGADGLRRDLGAIAESCGA